MDTYIKRFSENVRKLEGYVFLDPAHRDEPTFRVWFRGKIRPPHFNSEGAALAHLDLLQKEYYRG